MCDYFGIKTKSVDSKEKLIENIITKSITTGRKNYGRFRKIMNERVE